MATEAQKRARNNYRKRHKDDYKTITIIVPNELYDRVQAYKQENNLSWTDFVKKAIREEN